MAQAKKNNISLSPAFDVTYSDSFVSRVTSNAVFVSLVYNAKWSRWSKWSDCEPKDGKCGEGTRTRTRSCISGDSGEEDCVGSDYDKKECTTRCVKSRWSRWDRWSDCSVTCGNGTRSRSRTCTYGDRGEDCIGRDYDSKPCRPYCPELARWSDWSAWSECSKSCDYGERSRYRSCIDGGWFGRHCVGSDEEFEPCYERRCIYAEWSDWSDCSVLCGIGESYRTRECNSEEGVWHPDCPGGDYESDTCYLRSCGEWSKWLPWTSCSASCGEGTTKRERVCIEEVPNSPGCEGLPSETNRCEESPCEAASSSVDAPWYVIILQERKNILMEINEARLGGGSLINDRWVLTAAHAVQSLSQTTATSAILVLGINTKISGGTSIPSHAQIYRSDTVLRHPRFKNRTYDFDIALIKVEERLQVKGNDLAPHLLGRNGRVEFDSYTRPVKLPCISACDHVRNRRANGIEIASYDEKRCMTYATSIKSTDNPDVVLFGFGINDSSGLYSYDMKLQKDDTCETEMRKIRKTHKGARFTTRNLCTAKNPLPQPCQGSAGDPLVKEIQLSDSSKCWVQVGLFTKNWSCSSSPVQYYTDVNLSIRWIFNKSMN